MTIIKLKEPVKVKGKETKILQLDFDKLTGNDMIQAEAEARALHVGEASVFASMKFQAVIAAKATGCAVDDIFAMNASDFKALVTPVVNFLLG